MQTLTLDFSVARSTMISKAIISSVSISLAWFVVSCGSTDSSDGAAGMGGTPASGGATANSSGGADNSGGGSTEAIEACPAETNVTASSAHNVAFWSAVTLPTLTQVAPGTELSFDWSAVTTDFLTKPVNPASDILLVTLALWQLTPEQFASQINDDTLGSPAVAAFLQTEGQVTQTTLFSLESPAGPIPQDQMLSFFDINVYPPGSNFYTLMLGSDLTPGMQTRMIGGFELSAETANTQVVLTDDSTRLEYDVDFSQARPTLMPTGEPNITIDWSGMETLSSTESDPSKLNAAGFPFLKRSIKQVKVARYTQSEAELKQKETILRLDDLAEITYFADVVSGSTFDLSELMSATGESFAGIDSSHTWVLALINTDSKNPAPWYLTFLKECR